MALASSPSASSPASAGVRWPALESSPEVFNQFMWSLGVPEEEAEFHDVYGLDEDALDMVPQPVLAVILCYPDPPQDAGYPSGPFLSCVEQETRDQVYFIKQIESLGNACGTIALIHAIGNTSSEINLVENSCLDLFFNSTASMDPYKRALFLEKNDAMARGSLIGRQYWCHRGTGFLGYVNWGSNWETLKNRYPLYIGLCDVVEEHYICFVVVDGTLNELDGMKDGPIQHGSSSSKSLLQDAVHVIKGFMRTIPDSINFNLMVLSRKQNNAGDT